MRHGRQDARPPLGHHLRPARRRVGEDRRVAPPHRRRLVRERDVIAGGASVGHRIVRTVVHQGEAVERGVARHRRAAPAVGDLGRADRSGLSAVRTADWVGCHSVELDMDAVAHA